MVRIGHFTPSFLQTSCSNHLSVTQHHHHHHHHHSSELTIVPKPELRAFWGDCPYFSPPFGVTKAGKGRYNLPRSFQCTPRSDPITIDSLPVERPPPNFPWASHAKVNTIKRVTFVQKIVRSTVDHPHILGRITTHPSPKRGFSVGIPGGLPRGSRSKI